MSAVHRYAAIVFLSALAWAQDNLPDTAPADVGATFGTTVVIQGGLRGQIYYLPPNTLRLPKFEKLKPVGVIYTNGLNVPPRDFTEGFPGVTDRNEWFAIDYTGRFWIENPGKYRFAVISDDGSKLYIDGKVVVNNDGVHPPQREESSVTLAGGIHDIRLSYFQGPRTALALMLGVLWPGEKKWRFFNTNDFKPPPNPETWKFGKPDGGKLSDAVK